MDLQTNDGRSRSVPKPRSGIGQLGSCFLQLLSWFLLLVTLSYELDCGSGSAWIRIILRGRSGSALLIRVNSGIWIRNNVKILELWRLSMEPWRGGRLHWRRKSQIGALEVCRPVLPDLHHFHEEQDPDPHYSENSVRDPQ